MDGTQKPTSHDAWRDRIGSSGKSRYTEPVKPCLDQYRLDSLASAFCPLNDFLKKVGEEEI